MSMTIIGDNSGSNLTPYASPARVRAAGVDPRSAKSVSRRESPNNAVTEVINPARQDIAALLGESNIDNTARVERPMSIAAIRAAFNAF